MVCTANAARNAMPIIDIWTDTPVTEAGRLIVPAAPDTHEQHVVLTEFLDCEATGTLKAVNAPQQAHVIRVEAGATPKVRYHFEEPGPGLPDWAFASLGTRFDRASDALAAEIAEGVCPGPASVRVPQLMQYIADHFTYGKRPRNLGDDTDAIPAFGCDIATGTCVDMHTLGVAALRAIDVPAVYVIGCFVYAGKDEFPTGHCWLNLKAEGASHHYDISHHVEYGLGPVTPELNPKLGRRFALGFGRGPRFEGADGVVELPSLSGFHVLEGPERGHKLRTIGRFG
jgi:hypothetical protein